MALSLAVPRMSSMPERAMGWRRPAHAIGWLYCAVGVTEALSLALAAYALLALVDRPGQLALADWVAWGSVWTWPLGGFLGTTFLQLLFPEGRVGRGIWRLVRSAGRIAVRRRSGR